METASDGTSNTTDRYTRLVMKRFHAMLANPEFSRVQKKWLRRLRRRRPFATIDDWADRESELRENDPESRDELTHDVTALSESFAVAPWHVLWAVFVRKYDPQGSVGSMFPLDVWHARSHLLVTAPEPGLIENLQRLASGTGMRIGLRAAAGNLENRSGGGRRGGILLEVNLPLELPQDLAVIAVRRTLRAGKDIIRGAGFQLPVRVRTGNSGNKMYANLVVCAGDDTVLTKLKAACSAHELLLRIDPGREMLDQTSDHSWAPLANVRMEVLFAPEVGAEILVRFVKGAIRNARLALKVVGLDLGQRLRPSSLVELSRVLQVDGGRLARRGLGDLAEEQLGTAAVNRHLTQKAEKSISLAKSRRNKIKRRLAKKSLLK